MTRITFDHVTKAYGKNVLFRDFSLEIKSDELFVLLGASGAGKSTLLRLIAGIEEPTSGRILFDDDVVNNIAPKERDVALMFQSYALYPNKTAYQNLAFPLAVRKTPRGQIERAVKEVSEKLGIQHLLQKYPGMLSGGERQRLAVGRAMIRKPRVYLFDEPLTNLDAKLRVVTRTEIKRLQRELGATTVYATPDSLEATTIADRIAILREGMLQQVGTPEELYQVPTNTYVAGFVGVARMNFISCKASVKDGGLRLSNDGFDITLQIVNSKEIPEDVILGVRPEDVKLEAGQGGMSAKIRVVESTRPEMLVYLAVKDTPITALVPATTDLRPHLETKISFNMSGLRLFSAKTEKSIGLVWNG